jgi:hypothetical protein
MMAALIFKLTSRVQQEVFTKSLEGKVISEIISTSPFGRIAFRLSIFTRKLSLHMGWSQKAVEYMGG